MVAGLALVMCGAYGIGVASFLDARFSDLLFLQRAPHADIAIIAIDDKSIQAVGQWPWKRSVHAELITKLFDAKVRAVGYDVNFPEASAAGASDDAKLVQAVKGKHIVFPVELTLERRGETWTGRDPLMPIPALRDEVKLGMANVPRDEDGVARTVPLSVSVGREEYRAFADVLLRGVQSERGTVRVNFSGPPGNYPRYSAIDVLENRLPSGALKDMMVLVGATAPDLHDDLVVPTSHGLPMPGVEVHANILETLVRGNALHELPKPFGVLFILLYAFAIGLLLTRTKLRYGTALAFGFVIAHFLFALIAFEQQIVVPIVWPMLSVLVTYVAVVAIRYFHEQREREKLRETLNQYLSPAVVNDLLANPEKIKLGGERRTMTVLFSDLRGFTSLSEGLPPEMLVLILNHYLDVMTEKVFGTNGVVDKYMGDAIMAFWGASFLDLDHADRAMAAAIAMRTTLNEMNARRAWPGGVELNLGIGLNTGEMVVGNMGSSKRFDYTVMGDAVNLGSRLEGLNKEYGTQIIASEFAKRATTPGKFLFRPLDLVAVKGKKEPVEIFEVVGEAGAVAQSALEGAQRFEQAMKLYRAQKFAEAKVIFEDLAESGDPAAKMYVVRCEAFLEHPPASDWNGVWIYTKK